jgi:hypothetical protein
MSRVRVDPEFQSLIPALSLEERAALREKLLSEGCRERLVTWDNDPDNPGGETLVDGHHRYELCEDLSISFQTRRMQFADRDAVKLWMIHNQLGRRNLTDDQRAALAYLRQQVESEQAKRERGQKGAASTERNEETGRFDRLSALSPTSGHASNGNGKRDTREEAAKEARVTPAKVRAVADVAKDDPAAVAEIAAGRQTLREAKKQAKRKKAETARPADAPAEDATPAEPLPDWHQVAGAVDGMIGILRGVARDMRKAFAIEADTITRKAAQRYTRSGTVGAVNALIRYLEENKPVGEDAKGIITAADEAKRQALAKGRKAS